MGGWSGAAETRCGVEVLSACPARGGGGGGARSEKASSDLLHWCPLGRVIGRKKQS